MTRLEANILDFHANENADEEIETYRFRMGFCEDFNDMMTQFKAGISPSDRVPNPDAGWLWEVRATPKNRKILEDIFDNFSESLQAYESQMKLFGL